MKSREYFVPTDLKYGDGLRVMSVSEVKRCYETEDVLFKLTFNQAIDAALNVIHDPDCYKAVAALKK